MQYAGLLIRQERLKRNWSQEGLCKGICTVSYLSKIEQGKAEPSEDVAVQLLRRMDIRWTSGSEAVTKLIDDAYDLLFSGEFTELEKWLEQGNGQEMLCSPYCIDWMLLKRFVTDREVELDEALEVCLDNRQLALQRCLQKRDGEALRLYPAAFLYYLAGDRCYRRGEVSAALEYLQTAYDQAAREGRVRLMLYSRMLMGNCYSNSGDLAAMERHYRIAVRLAGALDAQEDMDTIQYNTAASQLENGQYAQAAAYFERISQHSKMTLQKMAICYEKLGKRERALEVLSQADQTGPQTYFPEGAEQRMCDVVRFRLEHPDHLEREQYGEILLECFRVCRERLPSGYALFHLPWVLEWYEHHRQYKQAYVLLRDFPEYGGKA